MTDQPLTDIPLPETLEGCLTLLEEACFPKRPPLPPEASEFEEISDPEKLCKNPLVSVTISTYKHEAWLDEALRGVLMQETDFPFEVIVADDASPDRTAEIALEWQRRHPDKVRVLRGKCNSYGIENHKRSKAACRAPWQALLEGDDYWTDPLKLQRQVDFLENHPDYVLCSTDCMMMVEKTGEVFQWILGTEDDITPEYLIIDNRIATLTTLYKKSVLTDYLNGVEPFMPPFLMGDYPLWLYFASRGKIRKLPYNTAMYRNREGSLSHSSDRYKYMKFMMSSFDIRVYCNEQFGLGFDSRKIRRMQFERLRQQCKKEWFLKFF